MSMSNTEKRVKDIRRNARRKFSSEEKIRIVRLVEESELSIRRTLVEINVSRSSFHRWYQTYERDDQG